MRSIRIRYLEARTLARGHTAYYYNPPADARAAKVLNRQPLGKDLPDAIRQAEDLNRILDEWRDALRRGEHLESRRRPGSVAALFERFRRSDQFLDKAASTRRFYDDCLRQLEDTALPNGRRFGEMPCADLMPVHVDKLYSLLRRTKDGQDRLAHANSMMRTARRVFYLGERWQLVKKNPFARAGLKPTRSRKQVWTIEQRLAFVTAAVEAGYPSLRLLMLIAYELAQRLSDVRNLIWDTYEDGLFRFEQQKTGRELQIPASDLLIHELEEMGRRSGQPIVVCETTGQAYRATHLSHLARDIMRKAGLPEELRLSDLRRTSLTDFGEAGATDDELMSVSGHLTRQMLQVYSVQTRNKAAEAISKRETWRSNAKSAPKTD